MITTQDVRAAYAANGNNATKTAEALGIGRTTVRRHLSGETVVQGAENNPRHLRMIADLRRDNDILQRALVEATRPRFTIRQDIYGEADLLRVLVIGDAHDDPTIPDKSRFYWAGQYARYNKVDVVCSIGDFLNLNSLCFHVPDESYSGKDKPTFLTDIASGAQAYAAFNAGLDNWKPEKHKTLGNHCNRIWRVEDANPSSFGLYSQAFDKMMVDAGFTYSPFGADQLYGGVAFTHIPLTVMGRPFSARNLSSLGNDAVLDTVIGHRHVAGEHVARKLGMRDVTIVDTGCFLPDGYQAIESYSKHTPGGWKYGLTDLKIRNHKIIERRFVNILTLEEMYG